MLENIRGHSRGSIPPLRMPSPLPHDLCHEWNVSRRLPAPGLPWWLSGKESTCNSGHVSSVPGSRRSPGEGNVYPLQYSCLGNPINRRALWTTVHGVAKVGHNLATKQQQLKYLDNSIRCTFLELFCRC